MGAITIMGIELPFEDTQSARYISAGAAALIGGIFYFFYTLFKKRNEFYGLV